MSFWATIIFHRMVIFRHECHASRTYETCISRIHNFTMVEIDLSNHGHEVYDVVFMIVLTFNGCLLDTYEHSDRL
jgi:hypothetical protein